MNRFSFDKTEHTQTKFLEYLAGAPSYRRVYSVIELFGNDIFYTIPSNWYEKKGGKIRIALAGWQHLTANGRVHHIRNITALLRAGRVVYNRVKGDWDWVMPDYLMIKTNKPA